MDKKYSKINRLGKETAIIIENGKRKSFENIVLYYMPIEGKKISVVASRKVGKSVERNKLKRWTREIFRVNKEKIRDFGIVIIYKPSEKNFKYSEIKEKLIHMWKNTGLMQ